MSATIPGTCVRRAWLTLGTQSIDLENEDGGWFCTSLDLGSPDVRAVTSSLPDRDGIYDGTRYLGARTVSADISALVGAGATIDAVASSFAPYMVPSARPVLHYVLDRPGAAERVLTLRGAGYSWKVEGDSERDIQLQWVAADPIVRDPVVRTAIAWAGYGTAGRTYTRTYPRTYPSGGVAATAATVQTPGDMAVRPLLRIYGPCTAPWVGWFTYSPDQPVQAFYFQPSFTIAAGHYVDVDSAAHTVLLDGDPLQSLMGSVNWAGSKWLYVPPLPSYTQVQLHADAPTSAITQVQVIWQDQFYA